MIPQSETVITRDFRLFSAQYMADLLKAHTFLDRIPNYVNDNTITESRKDYSKLHPTTYEELTIKH
jgi:hypothetical protein